MEKLVLIEPSEEYADIIAEYRDEFPSERMRVTFETDRIPGLDHLEEYDTVSDWLAFCREMKGKITWYLTIREGDGRMVGAVILRHSLEYDDDDEEFASHIGYSVRPSEQGKGFAKEQLRLCLEKARVLGLKSVRLVCRDINTASAGTILANSGRYVDTIYGEESEMSIDRYDIDLY